MLYLIRQYRHRVVTIRIVLDLKLVGKFQPDVTSWNYIIDQHVEFFIILEHIENASVTCQLRRKKNEKKRMEDSSISINGQ